MSVEQVAELEAAVGGLAELDPHLLAAAEMLGALQAIRAVQLRLAATFTRVLAAAIERDVFCGEVGLPPRDWLIEDQRCSALEASRQLRLINELPVRPVLGPACARGELSGEHARVILDAVHHVPAGVRDAVEEALVPLACTLPPHELAQLVDEVLVGLGVEKSSDEAHARRYANRNVNLARTFAGTGSLSGTLSAELTAKLQRIFTDCGAATGPGDDRTAAQRRHDRLDEMADTYLAEAAAADDTAGDDVAPSTTARQAPRPQLVVTVSLDTLLDGLTSRWATLDTGVALAPAVARRLACDAEIIPAVLGARGEVLDVGVASRSFSTAVRRAAFLRDGGRCAFPRCHRRIAECHHIVWWTRGGKSTLDNAAWLCRFHHWLAHEGGWALRRNSDDGYTWTSRYGREVTGDPPRRPPPRS